LCEVIERDAQMLWNLRTDDEQDGTRIDLATIDDPDCCSVLDRFERADMVVAVWDMTSDSGLPAFRCRIIERTAHPLRPLFAADGAGCHPVRVVALLRALTEAAQSRLTVIAGSRDDCFRADYVRLADPSLQERIRTRLLAKPGQRRFMDRAEWQAETMNEDIALILERLQAIRLGQVIVVNLTRAEFGIAVVRVVVPGLEYLQTHVRGRLGPRGRAYWQARQ
jgi:ribosomal protein S12 methylthiotransferase accessory factor